MDFDPEHELIVVGTYSGNITLIDAKNYVAFKVILFEL